jgi:hypothetical protein
MHIQLGNSALDRACPAEAADHFTAAVNTGTFLTKSAIDFKYEEFVVVCRHFATEMFAECLRVLCSSSGVTSHRCGKPQTRNGVMLSFGQVDL